jgi:tyrosyl-tRNA synthetase
MVNIDLTELFQGLSDDVDKEALEKRLTSARATGKKLTIKFGVDPTTAELHLGHAVLLKKLALFQRLGHQAVLVIGDFTAAIGDPSGVNKTRPVLSSEQIATNMADYTRQAGRIIDLSRVRIVHNADWYARPNTWRWHPGLTVSNFLGLAMQISVSNVIERQDFQERLKAHSPVGLHELLYPLVQAIDSVKLKADVELGGHDQRLNFLLARDLQKKLNQIPQEVVTTKLLVGTDGGQKMSSSLGNYIGLTESADQQFGKLMSVADAAVSLYGELLLAPDQLDKIKAESDPKLKKVIMAKAVVALFYNLETAERTAQSFEQTFSQKTVAEELVKEVAFEASSVTAAEALKTATGESSSQIQRLISQKAVKLNDTIVTDPMVVIDLAEKPLLKVGRRGFYRLRNKS